MGNELVDRGLKRLSDMGMPAQGPIDVRLEHWERGVFVADLEGIGRAVVKLDSETPRFERELLALRHARAAGVRVPEVLLAASGNPCLLALAFANGTPLGKASSSAAWRSAGAELRALHELPVPAELPRFGFVDTPWRRFFLEWADAECDEVLGCQRLDAQAVGMLREMMKTSFSEMSSPPLQLLHGDCQAEHFLINAKDDRVEAVIDFGDAAVGDPVWDLVVLSLFDADRRDTLFDGYGADAELRRRLETAGPAYRAVRLLGGASWLREHDFDDAREIEALQSLARGIEDAVAR